MAIRNKLAISKIDDFEKWLIDNGWIIEQPKGFYEVLRARKVREVLIIYKKLEDKEHYVYEDKWDGIVNRFTRMMINKGAKQ